MNRFYLKIILPSIFSILLFILTIFLIIIPQYRQSIMNGKREMIKELTNSASSILSKYESDERNGLITRDEAQKTAVSRIQYLRYGEDNKDYFWVTDMHPNMIVHPYRPDLNGKDLTDFSDPHGKKLFVEFVKTVKESDNGYVEYMWQWKDDSLHIVPKLSFVKIFKPWGWVIGTGVYIEDVNKEINTLTNTLIWISIGISILIASLLFFISLQSLKIERQRIGVVKELHDSKEKYRTLVEASTEGIIMLIDGKISFINSIICKMSGYELNELINIPLSFLISQHNSKPTIDAFSAKSVKEGQYELNFKKKGGGFTEVLATSSNAELYGKSVNIIVVKDVTIDSDLMASNIDYHKLISTLNIGFFRAKFDGKGKFLYANDTTIRILGYDNFKELSGTNIFELLVNPEERKNLRNSLVENRFVKDKVFNIRRKNDELAVINATLVVFANEGHDKLICDGIIEDISLLTKEKNETGKLIAELKSNSFLIEQPVKKFAAPVITLDADSTLKDALNILAKRKTDCIIVTYNETDYVGILTDTDIQKRVLALNLSLDNPVYLIMSSPVIYIHEDTTAGEAINICEDNKIKHAAVKNANNELAGIFKLNDIYRILKDSLSLFTAGIRKAETPEELKKYYEKLLLLIKPLIKSDIHVKYITNITSSFSDAITAKIIELTIEELGKPPAGFSFISMGSEGRKEETLYTDQDNAIIYEDVFDDMKKEVNDYFIKLGERVCNTLNFIGYSFCRGGIMAKNHQWCKPVSAWENYFTGWISTPEPQNLLDAMIFFDFRHVFGTETLTDTLREKISKMVSNNSLFLYHLAHNTYNTKIQHISSGGIISDKNTEPIDMKNAVNPVIMFARVYSLQNNIRSCNTIERIEALKSMHIINPETADELIYVYNYLMKLRLNAQVDLLDKSLPLSNILNIKHLLDIEQSILKKVLSLISAYQNKIADDFRILA